MSVDAFFQARWYARSPGMLVRWLTPLSWLFRGIVAVRRAAFRSGILRTERLARPVVVVGNLTVGGTGKTPLVLWLAGALKARGHTPGIVSRGYGGRAARWPQDVGPDSDPMTVGDEAVLLASRSGAIVVAGPDRVAAAQRAIERGADVILSDDGLQHYRLARDCELVVIDARRGLGNGRLLPAGPLREPPGRLGVVDAILLRQTEAPNTIFSGAPFGAAPQAAHPPALPAVPAPRIPFTVRLEAARHLESGELRPLDAFAGQRVHAVAGIGNPDAFFAALRGYGMILDAHPLPDHATLTVGRLDFGDGLPVLMTEKDAVKCRGFADERLWTVPLTLGMPAAQEALLWSVIEAALLRRHVATPGPRISGTPL